MTIRAPVDSDLMDRLRPHIEMAEAVEAELRKEKQRPQRVYFIAAASAVKIGIARNAERRLRDLQVGNHERLHLIGTLPGGKKREKRLHRKFADYALGGEWFRIEGHLAWYLDCVVRRDRSA